MILFVQYPEVNRQDFLLFVGSWPRGHDQSYIRGNEYLNMHIALEIMAQPVSKLELILAGIRNSLIWGKKKIHSFGGI